MTILEDEFDHGRDRRRPRRRQSNWPLWTAYTDVMTALFASMLALYVLSYWWINSRYEVSAKAFSRLKAIDESTRKLADESYFSYDAEYNRFVFRRDVQFPAGKFRIPKEDVPFLLSAGRRLESLVNGLRGGQLSNARYLVIIEGMSSNDRYGRNYELSYKRALALYRLWRESGIEFDDKICEVIIAGSGTGGAGRYALTDEAKNQRFIIQILPKIDAKGVPDLELNTGR